VLHHQAPEMRPRRQRTSSSLEFSNLSIGSGEMSGFDGWKMAVWHLRRQRIVWVNSIANRDW
jgi:hypothetical protein